MSLLLSALNMGAVTVFLGAPKARLNSKRASLESSNQSWHWRKSKLIDLLQWLGKGVHQLLDLRLLPVVKA
jgi:hypothetical protein